MKIKSETFMGSPRKNPRKPFDANKINIERIKALQEGREEIYKVNCKKCKVSVDITSKNKLKDNPKYYTRLCMDCGSEVSGKWKDLF